MEPSPAPKKSRSGTETRKRGKPFSVRLDESERAEVEAAAAKAQLTTGSYVRSRVLSKASTQSRRKPSVDVQAITRLQGEMNRVGNNIYQLRRLVNFGGTPTGDEIEAAFMGYREVIAAILATLGRVPK